MRQFVSEVFPDELGILKIVKKDYKYFRQVLRLSVGDMVVVRLPSNELLNMTVCKMNESLREILLQKCDVQDISEKVNIPSTVSNTEIWLFQFIAKGQKMDLIVRQATECGVKKIIPVIGDFCQSGTSEKNFKSERYDRIIKEARQQSGSSVSTELMPSVSVLEACEIWKNFAENDNTVFGCVLYERNENTKNIFNALHEYNEIKKCAIVCGAEGGISPNEIKHFMDSGIIPIHLDTNILRCETAALYGIASVQSAVSGKKLWQLTE